MITIEAQNVNGAFAAAVRLIQKEQYTSTQESRNGTTIEFVEPVATEYSRPAERVLFSPERDANPFFHFFEALWMLAGRNDVAFPASIVARTAEYSDDGIIAQAAYGHRWRRAFEVDQVEEIIKHLRVKPDSRRAVLTMWSPLWDFGGTWASKDIPCNTQAYFKVRDGKLRMTVCCRSNDMLWGAYGANVVHFSMLQEYIADKLGLLLGPYTQVSDSLHVYTGGPGGAVWERVKNADLPMMCAYKRGDVAYLPMNCASPGWGEDMQRFFALWDKDRCPEEGVYETYWWRALALPMWLTWKLRLPSLDIAATDWSKVAKEWVHRHPGKET